MIKIADITADICDTLKQIEAVGGRVFPIVANEGTTYPFIVFERSGVGVTATKDGFADIQATFNARIVSATYFEGLQILDTAIERLERMQSKHGITYRVTLQGASEESTDDGFVQTITFSV